MSDTTRTILHSATKFFSGTALSRVSGMLRDIAMAYAFGTQSSIAALFVAFRLAHLLRRLFGEGAMQTALIPLFEQLRRDDSVRGARFFWDLLGSLSVVLGGIIVSSMTGLWILMKTGILSSGNEEIAWLTFLMMPSLLFICLFGINISLLQCEKWYFIPSAAPILFNVLWIIGVACTAHLEPSFAVSCLAGFIVIACFGQWIVTVPSTITLLQNLSFQSLWNFRIKLFSPDVLSLVKPLSLAIIGIAATQINSALDAVFARWASPEGPAILWYAIRLQQLPLALIGVALSGAILPPLSRAAKSGDSEKFYHFFNYAIKSVFLWMIPITAMIFLLGDISISLIFGHGDFSQTSIAETTSALWQYGIGLTPMALILVYAPAFYAQGDYKTPSIAATVSMILNAALNFLFVAVFDLGTASIAFATSVSAFANVFILEWYLSKAGTKNLGLKRIFIATSLAFGLTMALQFYWGGLANPWYVNERVVLIESMSNLHKVLDLLVYCLVFGGVFLGVWSALDDSRGNCKSS